MKKYIYEYDLIFSKHKVLVADGECLVCKHCTDVFLDATHGPYMTVCEYTFINEDGDDEDLSDIKNMVNHVINMNMMVKIGSL